MKQTVVCPLFLFFCIFLFFAQLHAEVVHV